MNKNITINGYQLAIFKVEGNALHVTVSSVNSRQSVNKDNFKNDQQVQLLLYNEFSASIGQLPVEWNERESEPSKLTNKKILIVIIK